MKKSYKVYYYNKVRCRKYKYTEKVYYDLFCVKNIGMTINWNGHNFISGNMYEKLSIVISLEKRGSREEEHVPFCLISLLFSLKFLAISIYITIF